MKQDIAPLLVCSSISILTAIKQMDIVKRKLLIVEDSGKFKSLLSIGDIQRAIIANTPLTKPISQILRPEVHVASSHDDINDIKKMMRERRNEFMPIIDDNNNIVDVIFWEDLFENQRSGIIHKFSLPVVIMAGGKGERLRPLTNVLPKPLIPIGEQTMLEDIMDRFVECGCNDFFLSVNYKADFIRRYFENVSKPQYRISYFQEEKPLGTAGSLNLLKDKICSTFFVSNCDIIVEEDYSEILKFHQDNKNEITVVAAIKNYPIPYGTLETGDEGLLITIHEKPEYTFKINTGMYILEPHLLNEIPQNQFYHITTLIDKLIGENRKVGVFPVSEASWIDVGNWNEYIKIVKGL